MIHGQHHYGDDISDCGNAIRRARGEARDMTEEVKPRAVIISGRDAREVADAISARIAEGYSAIHFDGVHHPTFVPGSYEIQYTALMKLHDQAPKPSANEDLLAAEKQAESYLSSVFEHGVTDYSRLPPIQRLLDAAIQKAEAGT